MKKNPKIGMNVFIAASADILGDVIIGSESSVWYRAVVRGTLTDQGEPIRIGERTNIQDGCILHMDAGHPLTVGNGVTVGHGAILHGCTVGNNCLVGMGAVVMNGAVIGDNCLVGAGALVPQGMIVPEGQLVLGNPAKVKRPLTEAEIASIADSAAHYVQEAAMQKLAEAMDV